ncbi:phosphoglucomutase [Bacteroidia bacterium]|nr:phosphoglucomutase [Bacteroidia bacterium]
MNTSPDIIARAKTWLSNDYDLETREQVSNLINSDSQELTESFYRDLEFGTGGLRGIMGVGTNRMNIYTVASATQGFANYIKQSFKNKNEIKVVIAYDSRNNSKEFAKITAEVFAGNGFIAYLFDGMRPTPELSFAVRHLGCQAGVMITASHNPKEYNGYKAYWEDGGQLISPHDTNVVDEVLKIKSNKEVKRADNDLIQIIGKEIDDIYTTKIKNLSLSPEIIKKQKNLKIVYTSLHGAGIVHVPNVLKDMGFEQVYIVEEQAIPDGNFPTVKSPNPEEKSTLEMALNKAKNVEASLVLATDPDSDRVGVAIKKDDGEYMLLNGNQTGAIIIYYILKKLKEQNKLVSTDYIVKTIVTTELLKDMADKQGIKCYDVLTGFKYIADIIEKHEGIEHFIGGGEESYGYLIGTFVRDKDAVIACLIIAEIAAWAANENKSFFDILIDLYTEFGYYKEDLLSITKQGKSGLEEIQQMMVDFRNNPPKELAGEKVVKIKDYKLRKKIRYYGNEVIEKPISLQSANVLQFFTAEGSKITVRPSGTEPKIKFYFGVKAPLASKADFAQVDKTLSEKIQALKQSLIKS